MWYSNRLAGIPPNDQGIRFLPPDILAGKRGKKIRATASVEFGKMR
jgi:hypothetical protein